jgi:hypothetical protein
MFYNEGISSILFAFKSGLEFSFLNGTYTFTVNVQVKPVQWYPFNNTPKFATYRAGRKKTV